MFYFNNIFNSNFKEFIEFPLSNCAFLWNQPTAATEHDEQLIKQLIEIDTMFEEKFTVKFNSNETVDVE